MFRTLQTVVIGLCFTAVAGAHHSTAAVYFMDDPPVTLKGTVIKVEWQNPHIWTYIDVTDEAGNEAVPNSVETFDGGSVHQLSHL